MDDYSYYGTGKNSINISSVVAVFAKVGDMHSISVSAESIPKTAKITLHDGLVRNVDLCAASYASLKRGRPCS
jgi:hypothetical protein